jgi:4-hydroxy-3-methylbut-2-enyl diphosphate reductase
MADEPENYNKILPIRPCPFKNSNLHTMKIILAETAGFCMGVRRAVDTTMSLVEDGEVNIFTFGPLIHNPQVLGLLQDQGVNVLSEIPPEIRGTVIIRAHGIPPSRKRELAEAGATVIDATCPRVLKVQAIIKKYLEQNCFTIIIGDKNHAEVNGLLGYAGKQGAVVSNEDDIENLDLPDPYIIVSQTTQDSNVFNRLSAEIMARFPGGQVFNTICDSTHKRQDEVRKLCAEVDAMVVVGGKNSANTARLGDVARSISCPVYVVETEEELNPDEFKEYETVGVTAGASTPTWMIERVINALRQNGNDKC